MTHTQTESFVPLTTAAPPSPGKRTEFKATVMSQPGDVQKFQSIAAATIASTASATPRGANCEPRVNVQRDGNRVTGIQIQCSCGEVIELACLYEATAPQAATAQPIAESEPATTPQLEAAKVAPGKKGKEAGKVLPASAAKKAKTPEKGRGTSAAKRRSA
jgi:hypothetical protein